MIFFLVGELLLASVSYLSRLVTTNAPMAAFWPFLLLLLQVDFLEAQFDLFAKLNFPKAHDAIEDNEPLFSHSLHSYRRWTPDRNFPEHHSKNSEVHSVYISDTHTSNLLLDGFERVDLNARLHPILQRISIEGLNGSRSGPALRFNATDFGSLEDTLARNLQGWDAFRTRDQVAINLVCSGFVLRQGGPLGIAVAGKEFDRVARRVHIDQDIEGEPLHRLGIAWALNYLQPSLQILNLWTPLTTTQLRPLALMSVSTLDHEDVLRFRANSTDRAGGRFGSFSSDRMTTLWNKKQQWHWDSTMKFGQSMVFLTTRTAHSSFSIEPAEQFLAAVLKHLVGFLEEGMTLAATCDMLRDKNATLGEDAASVTKTPPATLILVIKVHHLLGKLCSSSDESEARAVAEDAVTSMVRKSLEIRCATLLLPRWVTALLLGSFFLTMAATGFITARVIQIAASRRRPRRPAVVEEKAKCA